MAERRKANSLSLKPITPAHDAKYWANATKGTDFSAEDRIDFDKYNHILWKGLVGDKPYPEAAAGFDLSKNRAELLSHHHACSDAAKAGGSL